MKKSEIVFTGISLGIVACFIFYGAYFIGTRDGYERGHENGFIAGKILGYENGYDNGYAFGLYVGQTYEEGIRDPTYREMMNFLERDNTNQHKYLFPYYVCGDFAWDVWYSARKENIRCAYIGINLKYIPHYHDTGHVLVMFGTIDKGQIYIEPQCDLEENVQVGKSWYDFVVESIGAPHWNDSPLLFEDMPKIYVRAYNNRDADMIYETLSRRAKDCYSKEFLGHRLEEAKVSDTEIEWIYPTKFNYPSENNEAPYGGVVEEIGTVKWTSDSGSYEDDYVVRLVFEDNQWLIDDLGSLI